MRDSQDIYVEGNKAAEITIEYNPLLIDVSAISKFLEDCSIRLAEEIAINLNKDETKGKQ